MKTGNSYYFGKDTVTICMQGNKECVVSKDSFNTVLPYTWCVDGTGHVMSRTFGKAVKMHRLLTGADAGEYVDHIDGNPLNNVISNLRICTKKQNEYNQKRRMDNSSGYKGVSYCNRRKRYRAYINKDGHQFHVGYYHHAEEAANAYNKKAKELFGDYARLNVVEEGKREWKC